MRVNHPVSQREFDYPADATLMSTTDLQSKVTYANAAFVAVSGFEAAEVIGQPHNLVRHPDMPVEAFADMWATLKAGEPWTALVKNRRKNGDHYWVRANATPVMRAGQPVGYMSVRTKPSRDEVAGAEALYAQMREGKLHGKTLRRGVLVGTGWRSLLTLGKTLPVRWRLRLPLLALATGLVGIGLAAGVGLLPVLGALALIGVAGLWQEQQVARPLARVTEHARRVAGGETESLHLDRVDEIGLAARSLNQLGLMFRWIIDDVSQQVATFETASQEIAQGNNDLSTRTEQAAASLEETAASMEQMSATVRNNAEAAGAAEGLANSASRSAHEGHEVVGRVTQTMQGITDASRKISDIIGVIDGIAFQTNILALNAAVEAARAGEQGRGFAVVAGEVRVLAQRSAQAAKEIKTLIGASVERVEDGVRQVADAGAAMDRITSEVRKVNELIVAISAATREQTTGVTQVTEAVSLLDQGTQQNAALVEQSAAAALSLNNQAHQLVSAVAVFRSGG